MIPLSGSVEGEGGVGPEDTPLLIPVLKFIALDKEILQNMKKEEWKTENRYKMRREK